MIPNQDYVFLPGLFVRVQVPVGTTDDALLVPDRGLGIDQRGHYLLVVGEDDVVEQRPVEIGALSDGMRVILQGLSADERVVTDGVQRAIPGSKVAPQKAAAAPAPPATPPDSAPASAASQPAPAPATQPAPAATQPATPGAGPAAAQP